MKFFIVGYLACVGMILAKMFCKDIPVHPIVYGLAGFIIVFVSPFVAITFSRKINTNSGTIMTLADWGFKLFIMANIVFLFFFMLPRYHTHFRAFFEGCMGGLVCGYPAIGSMFSRWKGGR